MEEQTDLKRLQRLIADRIRSRRKELGWSQEQLAERAGLSHNYLARLELGWNSPSLNTLIALSAALGMHVSDFVTTDEPWLDKGRELAHSLEGLTSEEADYVIEQFRAHVEFVRKQHKTR